MTLNLHDDYSRNKCFNFYRAKPQCTFSAKHGLSRVTKKLCYRKYIYIYRKHPYMGALKILRLPYYSQDYFLQNFPWAFVLIHPMNVRT